MLTRLCVEWSTTLAGSRFASLTQESADRFRLSFASESREFALVVCLSSKDPWIAEAVRRWDGPRWSPDRFVVEATGSLAGRRMVAIGKEPADRSCRLEMGDGWGLAIELVPHHGNLVLLGANGTVMSSLRLTKSAQERLAAGRTWAPRPLPSERSDPFATAAEAIEATLRAGAESGESAEESLGRRFAGLSGVAVEMLVAERVATGRPMGVIVRDRLDRIRLGTAEVLIESGEDRSNIATRRLLPWRPHQLPAGRVVFGTGPAATAGSFYEDRDAAERGRSRIAALTAILRGELERARSAERKVRDELRSFVDPERYRRMAEALLAGLTTAKRSGDVVVVVDPYDPDGHEISIPAPPQKALTQVADELFARQRRARRGLEAAGARAEALAQRAARLEDLLAVHERTSDDLGAMAVEGEMRKLGIPVGLSGPTRAARAAARVAPPKLDGVRIVVSADGWTILVGRTSRDNDRLTFKLAAPDDIWLHAAGVSGAHVVVRNPDRLARVPDPTLAEAARLALWFSDARAEAAADVHWTRRKNVRRAKGGPPGRVVLKRFETLRLKPQPPRNGA